MITTSAIAYVGIILLLAGASVGAVLALQPGGPVLRKFQRQHKRLDRELQQMFLPVSATRVLIFASVLVVVLLLLGVFVEPWCFAAMLSVAISFFFVFPVLRKHRNAQLESQLPAWLSILSNFLKVSGSIGDSLRQTVDMTRGPLGQELDLMLKELRLGSPLPDALKAMSTRVQSPVFATVVAIILIGRRTGGELPTVLNETAAALRERMRLEGVLRKQTAMGRSQMAILFVSPPVIILMFEKADPGFFRPLVEGGFLGQLIMASAVLMWLSAMFAARKILAVDL